MYQAWRFVSVLCVIQAISERTQNDVAGFPLFYIFTDVLAHSCRTIHEAKTHHKYRSFGQIDSLRTFGYCLHNVACTSSRSTG